MGINPNVEQVISLADAAKRLPARRAGKRTNISTLYRWTQNGCRGVVLESIQVGCTRCTSIEALERFIAELTEASSAGGRRKPTRDKAAEKRRQAAEAKLDRAGIGT